MRGFFPSENKKNIAVMRSIAIPSRVITSIGISVGVITPTVPKTRNKLKIFEPMILPRAISDSPRITARHEEAISGNEVPIAIIVRPMMRSLMPSICASLIDEYTRSCDAEISSMSPTHNHKIARNLDI